MHLAKFARDDRWGRKLSSSPRGPWLHLERQNSRYFLDYGERRPYFLVSTNLLGSLDYPETTAMLFHQGTFSPELFPDPRVRTVLCSAVEHAADLFRSSDILAGAISQGDSKVTGTLSQAMRAGCTLPRLLNIIAEARMQKATPPRGKRTREAFTHQVLKAFDEFEGAFRNSGGLLNGVALEFLLFLSLMNLDDQEKRLLNGLDAPLAAALFRDLVTNAVDVLSTPRNPRPHAKPDAASAGDHPFVLPPQLAPSEDLTHRVKTASMPGTLPFDGEPAYEKLFEALTRVLHRRRSHHVLLTGERGVGKSIILAELARRAAVGQIPFLASRRFVTIDCRYIPPDESRPRLGAILDQVANHPDLIVCVDGLAALLHSDRAGGNKAVLLSALAHARCQFLGLLTPREFEECFSDDPELGDFFARVDVEEPDPDVALKLLRHFALGLEQKFGVTIDQEAVRQAVVLSANYILNDQLPAKALKILDRVCEDIDYEKTQLASHGCRVTPDDVIRVVAEMSGVPQETLRGIAERSDYEHSLGEVILGQGHAVREVATELGLIKAGMTDPTKPASVMLFIGQTGTGKTEMAKVLARFYSTSKRLKTYTLGNCVEPHSVSTIIGVPPGYVGNDQGGRLINELNADPYSVFLLDEVDKAHPDVLQPFLNLFDEGWVCDQRGVRAYANKSIFVLTTNVGQRMIADWVQQGKSPEEISGRMKEALSQIRHTKSERPVFSPEFLARLKRLIVFNPLDQQAMMGIARKIVAEVRESWLSKRGKNLLVPADLIEYVGSQAHQLNEKSHGKEGGRIVRKLIAEWLEAPLQREITQRPKDYKECASIALKFVLPANNPTEGLPGPPSIVITFANQKAG